MELFFHLCARATAFKLYLFLFFLNIFVIFYFLIEVKLIYNVGLVSGVQQTVNFDHFLMHWGTWKGKGSLISFLLIKVLAAFTCFSFKRNFKIICSYIQKFY